VNIDSAREVKRAALAHVRQTLSTPAAARALGVRAQALERVGTPRTVAIGVSARAADGNDYQLAVRIQHPQLRTSEVPEQLRSIARGEADIQWVGAAHKQQVPMHRRVRPIQIGCSVGHVLITAGSLGAFVATATDGRAHILSNNHVLANENNARAGDAIVQPGTIDGGHDPADRVATLTNFVPLSFSGPNTVDCATALVEDGVDIDQRLDALGSLATATPVVANGNEAVSKIGRTTGLTHGTVTAIEVDNVAVGYDAGEATFNGQIEIAGQGAAAFSAGGDSGSLVFDSLLRPVGLLFAGTEQGGPNNMGVTYVHPLQVVLDALQARLLI
jgi:hypothetical protein